MCYRHQRCDQSSQSILMLRPPHIYCVCRPAQPSSMDRKRELSIVAAVCIAGGWAQLAGQTSTRDKQPLAEDVFQNIQLLKGIPVSEFMATMGFFSASLGLNCVYCHVPESLQDWKKFADDVPRKRMARTMIQMVNTINKNNFGGRPRHHLLFLPPRNQHPKEIPSLALQYGTPEEDPNEIEIPSPPVSGPSADEILGNFVKAAWRRRASRGGLDADWPRARMKAMTPITKRCRSSCTRRRRLSIATVIHTQNGESTTVFNGNEGWIASVSNPVPLLPLAPGRGTGRRPPRRAVILPGGRSNRRSVNGDPVFRLHPSATATFK